MDYQAILFDMDGTLVDSEHLHIRAWQEVLQREHLDFPDSWFTQWIGISDVEFSRAITKQYALRREDGVLLQSKRDIFRQLAERELVLIQGVQDGLAALKDVPKVVATSSNRHDAVMSLQVTGLWAHFLGLVSIDDVTNPKPHPEPYTKAAELGGHAPHRCIAVEDSVSGIRSAKAAGCFTIAVGNSLPGEQLHAADLVLANTQEAMQYIITLLR